jgi:hypothetical protein
VIHEEKKNKDKLNAHFYFTNITAALKEIKQENQAFIEKLQDSIRNCTADIRYTEDIRYESEPKVNDDPVYEEYNSE